VRMVTVYPKNIVFLKSNHIHIVEVFFSDTLHYKDN